MTSIRCKDCDGHGYVYLSVKIGSTTGVQKVPCNCPAGRKAEVSRLRFVAPLDEQHKP